jgi:hypothetical protein
LALGIEGDALPFKRVVLKADIDVDPLYDRQ